MRPGHLALAKKTKSKYLRSIQSALVKAGGSEKFLPVDSVEKVIAMFTPLKGQKFAKVTALKSALKAYHRAMAWPSLLPGEGQRRRLARGGPAHGGEVLAERLSASGGAAEC